jgi:hypothetical protein
VMLELQNKELINGKLQAEIEKIRSEAMAAGVTPEAPQDPLMPFKVEGEQIKNTAADLTAARQIKLLDQQIEQNEIKKDKLILELRGQAVAMEQGEETHRAQMAQGQVKAAQGVQQIHQGAESHEASMEQGGEAHDAKMSAGNAKAKPEGGESQLAAMLKKIDAKIDDIAADIASPAQIIRGKDGKPASVKKGKRTMQVITGPDGRVSGLQ